MTIAENDGECYQQGTEIRSNQRVNSCPTLTRLPSLQFRKGGPNPSPRISLCLRWSWALPSSLQKVNSTWKTSSFLFLLVHVKETVTNLVNVTFQAKPLLKEVILWLGNLEIQGFSNLVFLRKTCLYTRHENLAGSHISKDCILLKMLEHTRPQIAFSSQTLSQNCINTILRQKPAFSAEGREKGIK